MGFSFGDAVEKTNIKKIQEVQSKIFITNAPPYVSNDTLHHTDLQICFVREVAKQHYKQFQLTLQLSYFRTTLKLLAS